MIIKFRDATIKRFNVDGKVESEEASTEINALKQEIDTLKPLVE